MNAVGRNPITGEQSQAMLFFCPIAVRHRAQQMAVCAAGFVWAAGLAGAAASGAELAASASSLAERLRTPVAVFWSGDPLRRAIGTLCASQGVAVLLDRRVDPDRPVDLRSEEITLGQVLRQVAEAHGLGVTALGPVVYLGPPDAAAVLRSVARSRWEEVRKLPPTSVQRWLRAQRLSWDDLSEPRELVSQLIVQSGFRAEGLDRLPHDLWAGAELPPLPLVERLTLILIQFELTFAVSPDGQAITLVALPEELLAAARQAGGKPSGEPLALPGRGKVGAGKGRRPAEVRFTQKPTQGPVGVLLQQIANKLGLELRIDQQAIQAAGLSLDRSISFEVQQATLDELLEAVLAPAGLAFRRTGKVVEVMPASR